MKSIKPLLVILLLVLNLNVYADETYSINSLDEDLIITSDCILTINEDIDTSYSIIILSDVNLTINNDYKLNYIGDNTLFILNDGSSLTINNGTYTSSTSSIIKGLDNTSLLINDGEFIKGPSTLDYPMIEVTNITINNGSFISDKYSGVCINAKKVIHNKGNLELFFRAIKANNIHIGKDVTYGSISDIYLYKDGIISFDDDYLIEVAIELEDSDQIFYKDKRPITNQMNDDSLLDYIYSSFYFLSVGYDGYYYMYKDPDNLSYEIIDNQIIAKDNEDVPLNNRETLILSIKARDTYYTGDIYDGLIINDEITDITSDTYNITYINKNTNENVVPIDIGEYIVYLSLNVDGEEYTIASEFNILEEIKEENNLIYSNKLDKYVYRVVNTKAE